MVDPRDYADVLYPIEVAVLDEWDRDPALLDLEVSEAFAALARRYTLEERGQSFKPARLSDRAARLYESLLPVAEAQIGRTAQEETTSMSGEKPSITLSELAGCFKRLDKSVSFWSAQGGRQGYLEYVSQQVPRLV